MLKDAGSRSGADIAKVPIRRLQAGFTVKSRDGIGAVAAARTKSTQQSAAMPAIHGARFRHRVGGIKPLLLKIDAEHDRQDALLTVITRLRILRLDQHFQLTPWNHHFYRVQEFFTEALPPVLFIPSLTGQCHLVHRDFLPF